MKEYAKKNSRRLYQITVLAVSVMLAATSLSGCRKQQQEVPELLEPVTVEAGTVSVARGDLANITYLNVTVVPKTQTLSFEGSGKIQNVYVSIGDTVTAGQVLAELDQTDLNEQIQKQQEQKDQQVLAGDFEENAAYNEMLAATIYQSEAAAAYDEAAASYTKAQEEYNKAKEALDTYNEEDHRQETSEGEEASSKPIAGQGESESSGGNQSSESSSGDQSSENSSVESSYSNQSNESNESSSESSTDQRSKTQSAAEQGSESEAFDESSSLQEKLTACEQAVNDAQKALAGAMLSMQYANIAASKASLSYQHMVAENELSERQAQASIDRLTAQKQSATLTAPFDGKVAGLFFSPGQSVEPFAPVVVIADESVKYLQAKPFDNAQLELAKKLEVEINSSVQTVTYRAYDKNEYIRRTMREETLYAYFELSEPDLVSFGESGTVLLSRGTSEDTLYIPKACLQKDDVGSYVYKEVNGQREKTYVSVGLVTDSYVEILSGLSEGEVLYEN